MDRIKDLIDVQEQIETLEKQDFPAGNVDVIISASGYSALNSVRAIL